MAKANKFGTFGGVFTPSILTILGVIMYLRFPMILGQVGLWTTIGIIIIAHIISISTGLSVSSIATDKKVKAGGTYYIISRSLGLPIGGTLGLALFVGLSFSVSLYLIGFAESFLGFWGFPVNIENIRIAGSLILLTVTIITFISTSLAIKTQYLIMTAIFLSLLSIFFGHHEYSPAVPHFFNESSTVPIMVLFGIFFPAVTGFEAGVSMSGDLKDSNKSIPLGTIAAIAIGLIVYIGLAFFLSYTVQSDILMNDSNVLLKISLVPQLVVAGIWGATLSSALGSILAAPRILQATAIDKITPNFFAKGTRDTNEPRNALLITFLIAEAGILIGDLDVIARIVSIFFITTYGFLNLSAAFEAASSSDFRPSFRIPIWISILGALACFVVMIQLDFVALLGAIVILGLLYLVIKRKQLSLEGGDAWSSVWASLVKNGIQRLTKIHVQARNWRPNIILFAGGESERPELVEIGESLAGTLGLLTGFELEENSTPSQTRQSPRMAMENENLGFYKHRCSDIYSGMDEIIRVYGFKGIEPNTVLMGWSNNKDKKDQFKKLTKSFERNDISFIFLNHDEKRGFGNYRTIDIWWKGDDRNMAFALNIIRHFTSSGSWKDAKIRLLIVINHKTFIEKAYLTLNEIVSQYRINVEIKVINNSIDGYKWEEIIKRESSDTDLTMISDTYMIKKQFDEFHNEVSFLKQNLGSLLIIEASPQFEKFSLGIEHTKTESKKAPDSIVILPDLQSSKHQIINDDINKINTNGQKVLELFFAKTLEPCFEDSQIIFEELKHLIIKLSKNLNKTLEYNDLHRKNKEFMKSKNEFYFYAKKLLERYLDEKMILQKRSIEDGTVWYLDRLEQDILRFPSILNINYDKTDFKIDKEDKLSMRWFKTRKRILNPFAKTTIAGKVRYKTASEYYLKSTRYYFLNEFLKVFQSDFEKTLSKIRPIFISVEEKLEVIEHNIQKKAVIKNDILELENSFISLISDIKSELSGLVDLNKNRLLVEFRKNLMLMAEDLEKIDANKIISKKRKPRKLDKEIVQSIISFSDSWYNDSLNYFNKIYLDVIIHTYKNRIKDKLQEFEALFNQEIEVGLLKKLAVSISQIDAIDNDYSGGRFLKLSLSSSEDYFHFISDFETITNEFRKLEENLPESITFSDISSAGNNGGEIENAEIITLPLRKIAGYVIETQFIGSVSDLLGKTLDSMKSNLLMLNENLSLARFNLENISADTADRSDIIKNIKEETILRLRNIEEKISESKKSLAPVITVKLDSTFNLLSSYRIKNIIDDYSKFSIDNRSKLVKAKFSLSSKYLKNLIKINTARLLYSKSEGVLMARHLISINEQVSKKEKVLDLIESLRPDPSIMKELPHYYKNLFSGKSSIIDDFWIDRDYEEIQFEKSIKRFHSGVRGAILLLGERNSGKTTLCRYVTRLHFKEDKVHHIFPLKNGSSSQKDFLSQLQKSTHLTSGIIEIFETIPSGSVIVLHDLELWWDRSENGFEIIRLVLELIQKFDNKCLFIINMNPFTYDLINQIHNIQHHFISIITCQPFNSQELKEMVIRRHQSSGMMFRIQKKEEDDISEIAMARLFNKYFNESDGNPGTVLYQWLSNIEKASTGVIDIRPPESIDLTPIENIDDDSMVVLIQLTLQKRMQYDKLLMILETESSFLDKVISSLVRTGVLEERSDNLLVINPYVEPFIRKVLKQKGLV